jgi:hypothetical protein
MKSLSISFAAAVFVAVAGSAEAGQVKVHYTPFQTGNGGEFRIVRQSGYAGEMGKMSDVTGTVTANNVASSGKVLQNTSGQFYDLFSKGNNVAQRTASTTNRDATDFQTFCLERNETVNDNTIYSYSVNAGAIRGGIGGGNPDVVGAHTAFLYNKFRSGVLAGYNLWGSSVTETIRESSAKALQHVIWYFEEELGAVNLINLSNLFAQNPNGLNASEQAQATAWATAAVSAVNGGYTNTNVRALNLFVDANGNGRYDNNETLVQSQLTLIPLPSAAGLAMAGVMGITLRRRRSM